MPYKLGKRSLSRLEGVTPRLVTLVKRAIKITSHDFTVIEGLRTREQQAKNIAKGVSWTMDSRHLTGHAVDLAPWDDGIDWEDEAKFRQVGHAMIAAARQLDIPITWGALVSNGGDWGTVNDMPHFELPKGN